MQFVHREPVPPAGWAGWHAGRGPAGRRLVPGRAVHGPGGCACDGGGRGPHGRAGRGRRRRQCRSERGARRPVAEGVPAARIALAAADGSAAETRPPAVVAQPERGRVQVLAFVGAISPGLRRG